MPGARSTAWVTLVVGLLLAITSCSSDHKKLGGSCSAVFASVATDAEGNCEGPTGSVRVYATDCSSGPDLMAAEDSGGGDLAWARVGSRWRLLSEEGTYESAFRACTGQ